MSEYSYKVRRVGRDVIYRIYRDDVLVDEQEVSPIQLGTAWMIFRGMHSSLETIIEKCMKEAHKLGKQAIKNLEELEK